MSNKKQKLSSKVIVYPVNETLEQELHSIAVDVLSHTAFLIPKWEGISVTKDIFPESIPFNLGKDESNIYEFTKQTP